MRRFFISALLLLCATFSAFAQSAVTLPLTASVVADIGNGPVKVRVTQGNASIFTSQGSGTGSTSGASTSLTLTATPATAPLVGALISGTGITSGTTVAAYDGTTGITLSAAMTVPASTTVSWGAACPSSAAGIPSYYISASVSADYYLLYTQARVCAVAPGTTASAILVLPIFFDQTAPINVQLPVTVGDIPVFLDGVGSLTDIGLKTGTSGATLPFLNGTNTWSAPQTNSSYYQVTGTGGGAAGAVFANASNGLSLRALTGSVADFKLINPAGSATYMSVPTGLSVPDFPHGVTVSGNSSGAAGAVFASSANGLVARGVTGSANDLDLLNPGGTASYMTVPTGTDIPDFPQGITSAFVNTTPLYAISTSTCRDWTDPTLTTGLQCAQTVLGVGTPASGAVAGADMTAFGYNALNLASSGLNQDETAFGAYALRKDTNGSENTAIGDHSLQNLTLGTNNTALGSASGGTITEATFNIAIGVSAMKPGSGTNPGDSNIAIGANTLVALVGNGSWSGVAPELHYTQSTTGISNIAIGSSSGNDVTTGVKNTMVGSAAGQFISTGSSNVVMGVQGAGTVVGTTGILTGASNTFVGPNTGSTIDPTGSTALGSGAIVTASNQMSFGSSGITSWLFAGVAPTGSGAFVRATTPTLVTPILGVASATSLALGGATIGTDALAITGNSTLNGNLAYLSGSSTKWCNLADCTTNFENGAVSWAANLFRIDTTAGGTGTARGLVLNAAGSGIFLQFAGSSQFSIVNTQLRSINANGAALTTSAATATVPTLTPNRGSTTTGFGGASGTISAIVAGVEIAQYSATAFTQISGQTVTKGYTVATLPTGITGGRAHVTDQLTACPALGGTFTGGGAVVCPAFYNGTAWVEQ